MTSEYQEISTNKLLDAAKQLIITDELHLAEFYLNLIKYSNNSDSIGAKIQSIYNLSSIYKLLHNEPQLLHIGRKILKWITLLDLKRYNQEVLLMIIQILLNCAEECQSKDTAMLTGWFLFISKNISMEHSIKDATINDKIRTMFPKFLKQLNESLYETYQEDLKTKKQNLINLSQSVKAYLSQTIKYNIGDTVYIIDSNWLNNMTQFIIEFSECKDKNEKLFTANNVCLLYYDKSPDVSDIKGHFCGPINNFLLTRPKCYWEDPLEQYTNVFVSRGVSEGKDYYVVNKELYTKINFYFKHTNEIERKCVALKDNNGNVVVPEVHLFNINVLYLNEYIRSKNKEDIIPKAIQISYHATLNDVIKKVERCFIHYAKQKKYEDYEYEFKMYLIPFNKKEIIEMILWYVNLNKTFKFKGDDLLSMNSSLTVDTIFNTTNSNSNSNEHKYIIICEPISKNSIVKPFLKKLTDTLNCSCCNFIITTTNNIIRCSHCSQAIYCSDKCKSQDHHHIDFHKKINSLYEASLNVEEIQQININAFLDGKSRHGLVGLKNTGGIDFLLSPLQVLSHCKELTKFFLTGNFKSSKAKEDTPLCCAYAELINQLWVGSSPVVSPTNFRNVFFILIKELANASGIDACDIFVVILDKLHSELNEIKKRPDDLYFYEQDYGESDIQACNRWWKAHNLMNKSVIIDLFQGQIKRKIVCSVCKSVSVAYPPFLYIDLPIPDKEEMSKIHFRVFPYDYSYQYVSVEMYDINKFTTVKDIKKRIKEYKVFSSSSSPSSSTTVIEALLYKDCELVQILPDDVLIYDYIFTRYNFSDEEFIEYEISFIEKPKHEDKSDTVVFYVTPITFEDVKGYFYTSTNIVPLSYSKVFSIKQKLTIRELYKEIFKYYRRAMDDMVKADDSGNIDDSYYTSFYQKLNDDTFIDNEYDKFTASTASNHVVGHGVFELYFYHNFEHSNSWFFSGPKCEFCGNTAKTKYCKLNLPQSTQLKELTLMLKSNRPIFILVDFTKYKECFPQFYSRLADMSDPRLSFVEDVNIYDCFDIYQKEEKLKKEKEYECVKCRRKAEPLQQIELYRASKYLILNIKRFKKKFDDLMDMINNKKNETLVEFPLENLDLTSYFYGENEECVYDLIAIICHVGTIKSGHYFSIVKNEDNWYKIDDTEIVQLEKKGEVINKDALVLVYYKRDIKTKKKIKEDDDVLKINTSINAVSDVDFGEMKGL